MAAAALKVAIRCALAVAVHSTVACDARGWHGECIEGHAGDSKKHIRELRGSELPPVSERLPRHSGLLSWGRERECGLSVAAESTRALVPSAPCPSMKHVAELGTEDLQALLWVSRKRVKKLELLLARRAKESDASGPDTPSEPKPTPCMSCCNHVWINKITGPRDNGDYDLVCERCGLAY